MAAQLGETDDLDLPGEDGAYLLELVGVITGKY